MDRPENELRGYIQDNGKPMWTAHNNHNIRYFKEEEIRIITNNYGTLLGKGAFGEVYKGVLDDNSSVAVKRYIHNIKENFAKEVIVHCHINHQNVVRLIGYCIGENALMMVTEYISKGNLSDILHCSEISISLETRLGIAIGCAEALSYMHSQMYGQVIHGDIKPANILLDEGLNAKISDFGISKLLLTDNTLYTTHVLGSIGYMDPLFARNGRLTSKSDVYSFGVVLLELITRRKAVDGDKIGLTENFTQALKNRKKIRGFYDVKVADENNLRILDGIGKLAAKCLALDLKKRPEMTDVAESLRMFRKAQHQPQEKVLLFGWIRRSKQPPQNMVPTENQILKAEVQAQKVSEVDRDVHSVTVVREGSPRLYNFGSSQGIELEKLSKGSAEVLEKDKYSRWEVQPNDMEEELSSNMEKELHLLDGLQAPSKTEKLRIRDYQGSHLPRWMTKKSDSCGPANDTDIVTQTNPPEFSHITKLVLDNLPNLEHLGELVDFPLMKILKLRGMPKLVELLTTTSGFATGEDGVEVQCRFPQLSTLVISDCPKLVVKPYFPLSLQSLTLEGSNEQLVFSGCFFQPRHHHAAHAHGVESSSSSCILVVTGTHLKRLRLGQLIGSSSAWEVLQHVTGLHTLDIFRCTDLTHLPESIRGITSLRRLKIEHCANLRVLPYWLVDLKSLQSLDLQSCNALQQLPEQIGGLCSLQDLTLMFLSFLTCLPKSMQLLTSLRTLHLYDCVALTQLPEWLGELSALQTLMLTGCPGLTSLPRSIRRLTGLKELVIISNPELLRRCKEGVGEDWHLVSHIENLHLWD